MNLYVPAVSPKSARDIEEESESILRRFYPRLLEAPGLFPVIQFFDHILKEYYSLDSGVEELSDGVEGMTFPDGQVLVSEETYRRAGCNVGRSRFTIAHECYHGIFHRNQIRRVLIDSGTLVLYRRGAIPAFRDPEWQADYFAGAILMPKAMVSRLACISINRDTLLRDMADHFRVSHAAATVRLGKLGL